MLTGLPGTTIESLISDALTIKKIILDDLVDIIGNKIMVPYPGTYYYEYAKQYSIKIRSNNWSQYDRRSFPVYSLKNLSAEEIYFGYLLQEATLVHSYFDKLRCNGISTIDIKNVTHGLDYLYANYIENLITN